MLAISSSNFFNEPKSSLDMRESDRPDLFQTCDVVAVLVTLFLATLVFGGKSLLLTAFLDPPSLQEITAKNNMQTQAAFIISAFNAVRVYLFDERLCVEALALHRDTHKVYLRLDLRLSAKREWYSVAAPFYIYRYRL